MGGGTIDRLAALRACRVHDRAAVERQVEAVTASIRDLHARLEVAQARLAESHGRIGASLVEPGGRCGLDAQAQVARERRWAQAIASDLAAATDAEARRIVAAAHADGEAVPAAVHEGAQVIDLLPLRHALAHSAAADVQLSGS